jgi:outer membrane protein
MNNLFFALAAMLLTLVSQAQTPPASTAAPCMKIGYADMPYIFSKMPAAKQAEAELKSLEVQLKNQLEAKRLELQKKNDEFTKHGPSMIEAVRQNTLRELELLNNNLGKFQEDAEATLQRKHAQLMEPLYKSVGKAIEDVAKEHDFAYILNPQMSGVEMVLYADKRNDVSDLVLKKIVVTAPAATRPVLE